MSVSDFIHSTGRQITEFKIFTILKEEHGNESHKSWGNRGVEENPQLTELWSLFLYKSFCGVVM